MISHPASRLMSAASAGYGVYCAVRPRHLGKNMQASGETLATYDKVAYGYALRDIPVSLTGMFGPGQAVEGAMKVRIASDLTDALSLGVVSPNGQVRSKILGITLGWAALNTLALAWDRRRA